MKRVSFFSRSLSLSTQLHGTYKFNLQFLTIIRHSCTAPLFCKNSFFFQRQRTAIFLFWGYKTCAWGCIFRGCCSTSGVSPPVCECARYPVPQLAIFFRHAPTPLSYRVQKLSATSGPRSVSEHRSCQTRLQTTKTTFLSS